MTTDFAKVVWHNFTQKPIFDRVFYVPFWDCPYNCDFCCVDSLPGSPKPNVERNHDFLFSFLEQFAKESQRPVALHYYGGEPLLRINDFLACVERAQGSGIVSKIYLYSTLRPKGALEAVQKVSKDFLRVVVNEFTATDQVREVMHKLKGVAEFYDNPVVFHTGRARNENEVKNKNFKATVFEKLLPASFPGRSCFANASGPLINGAHQTVHLCCLPQSPVFGTFDDPLGDMILKYKQAVSSFYKTTQLEMVSCKSSHACNVCEKWSQWDTKKVSQFRL